MTDALAVNEIFGPTVQGEGRHAGRQAIFLRLAGCNLKCSWCDTKYTWNWAMPGQSYNAFGKTSRPADEIHGMAVGDVIRQLWQQGVEGRLLVLTGGEPLLQQRHFDELFGTMFEVGPWAVEIETNGTIVPSFAFADATIDGRPLNFVYFNVSPKLGNSGTWNAAHVPIRDDAMLWHATNGSGSNFKFVCRGEADLDAVAELVKTYDIRDERVWIMPEGETREHHLMALTRLAEGVIERNWNLTTRIHLLAWDQKRAV